MPARRRAASRASLGFLNPADEGYIATMNAFALDPVLLTSFLAVAEARSFTSAGRKLHLQQSTVSQHVKRLEDTVGRRLFVRDTHSVKLTQDGAAMLEFAKRVLEIEHR